MGGCTGSSYVGRMKERNRRATEGIENDFVHLKNSLLSLIVFWYTVMAGSGSSMLYSFLLFIATLSLQEVYRGKLASSELYTILGGFTSSLIFILLLTFIGNYQETSGVRTGWGAVILAEVVALIAASTVHRVSITTCFLFSAALLYEVNKLSGVMVSRSQSKGKRY